MAIIVGKPGNDTLTGSTDLHDTIVGNGGNDVIIAHATAGSLIFAGTTDLTAFGPDTITGAGHDTIMGGGGSSIVGGGNDGIFAGLAGSGDIVHETGGTNIVLAVQGNNTVQGATGLDFFVGAAGNSRLTSGTGAAVFFAGSGKDTLDATNAFASILRGNMTNANGGDSIHGSASSDSIESGFGAVTINGGGGNDLITLNEQSPIGVDNNAPFSGFQSVTLGPNHHDIIRVGFDQFQQGLHVIMDFDPAVDKIQINTAAYAALFGVPQSSIIQHLVSGMLDSTLSNGAHQTIITLHITDFQHQETLQLVGVQASQITAANFIAG